MAGYLVATAAALAAIPPASRTDGMIRFLAGTGWYEFRAASTAAASLDWVIQPDTGTGCWHLVSSQAPIIGAQPITLTDANTVTPAGGSVYRLTMAQSRTTRLIAAPTGLIDGQDVRIWLKQPAAPPAGGCKITLAAIWRLRGGGAPALNPAANALTLLQGQYLLDENAIMAEIGGW